MAPAAPAGSSAVETTFRSHTPAVPATPVVLSVPHAGTGTAGFADALVPGLDVRCDADLLVDGLYGIAERTGGGGASPGPNGAHLAAALSRFVCDLNRHPDDVSAEAVPQHPAPRNRDGRGFIWTVTTTGAPALARPLTLGDWRARADVHAAYHGAIAASLQRARARFGFAVLVDGHSMPSVGRAGHADPGRPRADVVPGDRDGTSCSPALSRLVESHFISNGYSVTFNNPYKGGFITTHHGRPADDIHAIQIELRRDLYMDELTFAPRPAGFARLHQTLRDLLASLDGFRP
jgi:N-formylglutamate deformylase